jgi:hypothetical protein
LSPHPKFPFLADNAQQLTFFEQRETSVAMALLLGRALLRIQPQRLKLPTPFRWSIAQPLDVDAARQASPALRPHAEGEMQPQALAAPAFFAASLSAYSL